jgi:hypothetical protein
VAKTRTSRAPRRSRFVYRPWVLIPRVSSTTDVAATTTSTADVSATVTISAGVNVSTAAATTVTGARVQSGDATASTTAVATVAVTVTAPPPIVFSAQTGPIAISTTTPKTESVTVAAGDMLIVLSWIETGALNFGTPSGGGYTYTPGISKVDSNLILAAQMWSAPITSDQTYTLSQARSTGSAKWSYTAYDFIGVAGIGASASASSSAVAPATFSITTTVANSAIVLLMTDANGAGAALTYSTATAGTYTQVTLQNDAGLGTFYGGYYSNAGAVGVKTVGATNTSLAWLGIALELTPVVSPPPAPVKRLMAVKRASYY